MYTQVPEIPISYTSKGKPRKLSTAKFLKSLYDILSDSTNASTIQWSNDGLSFQIINIDGMSNTILPLYFKHAKYSSFQRQLNYFGFRKWTKTKTSTCTFSHPYFTRQEPDQIRFIRRKNHSEQRGARKFVTPEEDLRRLQAVHSNLFTISLRTTSPTQKKIQRTTNSEDAKKATLNRRIPSTPSPTSTKLHHASSSFFASPTSSSSGGGTQKQSSPSSSVSKTQNKKAKTLTTTPNKHFVWSKDAAAAAAAAATSSTTSSFTNPVTLPALNALSFGFPSLMSSPSLTSSNSFMDPCLLFLDDELLSEEEEMEEVEEVDATSKSDSNPMDIQHLLQQQTYHVATLESFQSNKQLSCASPYAVSTPRSEPVSMDRYEMDLGVLEGDWTSFDTGFACDM